MVYYNEHDKQKAAWLRELIARNLIAPGEVDERSIVNVQPGDLRGYRQCHFFAGIGVWSYALRLAGWSDDRPVWTASCPCQPFSAAGKRKGTADHRHLWPELFRLIEGCRPIVAIGEQVAGKDGLAWLGIVRADLDQCGYTCGRVVSPACGYGAPHRRERLYWCALAQPAGDRREQRRPESGERSAPAGCSPVRLADSAGAELPERGNGWEPARAQCAATERDCGTGVLEHGDGERRAERLQRDGEPQPGSEAPASGVHAGGFGEADGVGDAVRKPGGQQPGGISGQEAQVAGEGSPDGGLHHRLLGTGATRGAWARADWILCRPQRVGDLPSLRPIKPGAQRLAHGDSGGMVRGRNRGFPLAEGEEARPLRLKGYGDAIVATQAQAFIEAVMEEL